MTTEETMKELKAEIQSIDREIVRLLNQRADFCTELNNLRRSNGDPTRDTVDEMEIMLKLEKISDYTNMIDSIYPAIFKYASSLYSEE